MLLAKCGGTGRGLAPCITVWGAGQDFALRSDATTMGHGASCSEVLHPWVSGLGLGVAALLFLGQELLLQLHRAGWRGGRVADCPCRCLSFCLGKLPAYAGQGDPAPV